MEPTKELAGISIVHVAYRTLPLVLASGLLVSSSLSAQAVNACDLSADGVVNSTDVNWAVEMALGTRTCNANVQTPAACNVVTVQRIVNALTGACIRRMVTVTWTASSSTDVSGYNIYRATTSGGTFVKLNSTPVTGTSYVDSTVQPGQTYYYKAKAVNSAGESADSNPSQISIPS